MKAVSVALFASIVGCAFVQPVLAADGAKTKEKVLHSFGTGTDGQTPWANLVDVNGMLYGTTVYGGANGSGAAFAINQKTGAETVLYSFCPQIGCPDGQYPYAGLIDVNGTLYGTTTDGGNDGKGAVFSIDPTSGKETVVYSFIGGADGTNPIASLLNVNGTLYGTTGGGGGGGNGGTVFSVDPTTGKESVLYTFCSQQNCADGADPHANLIDVNGTLYGTTGYGGNNNSGVAFALDLSTGAETELYSFCSQQNCTDGKNPYVSLTNVKGTLYGTTGNGGAYNNGTVFTLDPTTDTETVVYSFCSQQNCPDGSAPYGSLIDVKGTLYGTTLGGGSLGYGTVYSLDPDTDAEAVVHSFGNGSDGRIPDASLINVKGKLYSTTLFGGTSNNGTVFEIKKP